MKLNPPTAAPCGETIRGSVLNTNYRYTSWTHPIAEFEWDVHELWYIFIQAARITAADDPAQDRLVAQLLYAQSLGTLRRTTTGTEEEAITSDGARIWTDLPYLVSDLREAWLPSTDLSPTHRDNLTAFTARVTALGVRDPELSVCAVWLLRAALETPRPLTRADAGDEVPLAELPPACVAWFQYCSHKLLTLSVNNHASDPRYSNPGALARDANISSPGFSGARWLFWRPRFKQRSRCADAPVARESKRGFGWMINRGREMGYDIPGEANYAAKVQKALTDEWKRSGKKWVSTDEIVIDLDWTD